MLTLDGHKHTIECERGFANETYELTEDAGGRHFHSHITQDRAGPVPTVIEMEATFDRQSDGEEANE